MLAGATFPGHSVRLLKNERWQRFTRKAGEASRFVSLGEGDSRNPFPNTPGPMLTRRLKPDGYSKVKGRGKTISRARKILSSAQKIIRSAPRRREKRMARAIFWGATVFRNAANGPEKFQFRIAILARGVCAKSLDVSFVAPSNPRGRHGPRFAPT